MIKEFLEKIKQRKAMQKDMEDEDFIIHRINEKKKSPNERELESYLEEKRQEKIKDQLLKIRKQKLHEYWSDSKLIKPSRQFGSNINIMKAKPLFNGRSNLLNENRRMF